MLNLEYLKQLREINGVEDIIQDIEKLNSLIYQGDWGEVEQHLRDVAQKHPVEKALHNAIYQNPPQTIQQSAVGCRQFLLALGSEKITKVLLNHLGGK